MNFGKMLGINRLAKGVGKFATSGLGSTLIGLVNPGIGAALGGLGDGGDALDVIGALSKPGSKASKAIDRLRSGRRLRKLGDTQDRVLDQANRAFSIRDQFAPKVAAHLDEIARGEGILGKMRGQYTEDAINTRLNASFNSPEALRQRSLFAGQSTDEAATGEMNAIDSVLQDSALGGRSLLVSPSSRLRLAVAANRDRDAAVRGYDINRAGLRTQAHLGEQRAGLELGERVGAQQLQATGALGDFTSDSARMGLGALAPMGNLYESRIGADMEVAGLPGGNPYSDIIQGVGDILGIKKRKQSQSPGTQMAGGSTATGIGGAPVGTGQGNLRVTGKLGSTYKPPKTMGGFYGT